MGIVMRHEARQVPSWLIFDVGQKMKTDALIEDTITGVSAIKPPRVICMVCAIAAGLALGIGCVRRETGTVPKEAIATGVSDTNPTKIQESLLEQGDHLVSSLKKHSHEATNHEYMSIIQRMESCLSDGRIYHLNDRSQFSPRHVQAGFYEVLFAFGRYLDWTVSHEPALRADQNLVSKVGAFRSKLILYERRCAPFEISK